MSGWLGGGRGPPKLAERLLSLVVADPAAREGLLGDLFEEYHDTAEAHSHPYATGWYWWCALRIALRYLAARLDDQHAATAPDRAHIRGLAAGRAVARDLEYAYTTLTRRPVFAIALMIALGAGIGASTTIFSVFNAVVLRPIPFPEPDRLIRLSQINPQGVDFHVSQPDFLDFRDRSERVLDLAAVHREEVTLLSEDDAEKLAAGFVTSSLFRVLEVGPAHGRLFLAGEGRPGQAAPTAVLSHDLWVRRFGGDPAVVGRTLRLDQGSFVIVGIAPDELDVLPGLDLWLPRAPDPDAAREDHRLQVFGRLRSGVGLPEALDQVQRVAADLSQLHPASNAGWGAHLIPLTEYLVGPQVRLVAVTLASSLGLLLLLIGANISNLLMARTTARQTELGVRSALGAGRWGVARQLLSESALIGLGGAVVGIVAAYVLIPVVAAQPELVPRMSEVDLDSSVFAFALLASAVEGLGIGLGSAVQAARLRVQRALTETGVGTSRSSRRVRDGLVVGQVAMAMTLLVAAGLLARSFQHLQRVDPGFRTEGLMAVEVQLSAGFGGADVPSRYREVLHGLRGIPGVMAAAATDMRFFDLSPRNFTELGRVEAAIEEFVTADWRVVTDDYFVTTEVPVLAGAVFGEAGGAGEADAVGTGPRSATSGPAAAPDTAELVGDTGFVTAMEVVVGATLARRLWPGEEAVGQLLRWDGPGGTLSRVIGVVGDVSDVHHVLPQVASVYVRHRNVPARGMTILLRLDSLPPDLAASVRREIRRVDSDATLAQMRPVDDRYSDVVALERFLPRFLSLVAAIAVMLAAFGIYGLVSFTVRRRGHEIGVRLALGGRPRSIVLMLFKHGVLLVTTGVVLGTAIALAASRVLSALLFQTEPSDPLTYVAVGAFLLLVGMCATYLPSRRAARVDPRTILPA
jgi:predicted permease